MNKEKQTTPILNSRTRKALARQNRKRHKKGGAPTDARQIAPEVNVITDGSYIDHRKKNYSHGLKAAKERIAARYKKFDLPVAIDTIRKPFDRLFGFFGLSRLLRLGRGYTSCLIINRDGHARDFMPDKPGRHVILCHRDIARHLVSEVCMLVRITSNTDEDGHTIDGSWAITPAEYVMMRATTIQHLRLRPWFFLHRYWYEISFDGRVQPAHLFYDYGLNPLLKRKRMYVTHEYVPVRNQDATNDYFRFWKNKPSKSKSAEVKPQPKK